MDDFQSPLLPMRFQSQLGKETKRVYKEGQNVVKLSLARVVKVNYKYNTVDVVSTLHKNTTTRNPADNGKFSARLPVSFGGRTPEGKVYGSNTLVTVGSLVLLGFLEGNKDYPIVLNVYGDTDNQSQLTRTTFTSADESDENLQKELWQLFTLYPSMTYKSVDGNGNKEVTFSGKTFMIVSDADPDNAYIQDGGFDYEDLPNSRYANGELIEPKSSESPTFLYVHQGVYDDHRVTFFIKSDGTVRLGSRHKDGEGITFQELNTDGSFSVIQKKDTTNPEEPSNKFSQIGLTETGHVILESRGQKFEITDKDILVNGEPLSGIGIDPDVLEKIEELDGKVERNSAELNIAFDEISSKVEREEVMTTIEGIESERAEAEEAINDRIDQAESEIDNVSKNIPYRAEIVSTNGNVFRNGDVDTTLFCVVYRGKDNITDTITADKFIWTRVSDDPAGDDAWNADHSSGAKSIKITGADVQVRATFNCEVLE